MKLEPAVLENQFVRLEPRSEAHRDGTRAAGADAAIWTHMPFPMARDGFDAYWQMQEQFWGANGIIFTVIANGAPVGQTCFLNIRALDAGVEIGGTWYAPAAQGGVVNPSCKLLLMAHAFASGAERVELKTDARNARSRAAILKLGATFEGIHRKHMRRGDGTLRDTAWFSVIKEEWPQVRAGLEARIGA